MGRLGMGGGGVFGGKGVWREGCLEGGSRLIPRSRNEDMLLPLILSSVKFGMRCRGGSSLGCVNDPLFFLVARIWLSGVESSCGRGPSVGMSCRAGPREGDGGEGGKGQRT